MNEVGGVTRGVEPKESKGITGGQLANRVFANILKQHIHEIDIGGKVDTVNSAKPPSGIPGDHGVVV